MPTENGLNEVPMFAEHAEEPRLAGWVSQIAEAKKTYAAQKALVETNTFDENPRLRAILAQVKKQYLDHFGTETEQINIPKLWLAFAELRIEAHEQNYLDLKQRLAQNPQPTAEEVSMGALFEDLEPQVRNAIRVLRRKGYPTFVSGFTLGGPAQSIRFQPQAEEALLTERVPFSTDFLDHLRQTYGIALKSTEKDIFYLASRPLSLDQITNIWNEIADATPDRGRPAPQHTVFEPGRFN